MNYSEEEMNILSDTHTLRYSLGPLADHFDLETIVRKLREFNEDPIQHVSPAQIVALMILNQKDSRND